MRRAAFAVGFLGAAAAVAGYLWWSYRMFDRQELT